MEQVQALMDDKSVHLAAPIVLAGAAPDASLRGLFEASGAALVGKSAISSFAAALQKAGVLSKQEVKDVTARRGSAMTPLTVSPTDCRGRTQLMAHEQLLTVLSKSFGHAHTAYASGDLVLVPFRSSPA